MVVNYNGQCHWPSESWLSLLLTTSLLRLLNHFINNCDSDVICLSFKALRRLSFIHSFMNFTRQLATLWYDKATCYWAENMQGQLINYQINK